MSVLDRLDAIDRRLGLAPKAASDRPSARWLHGYLILVVAFAALIAVKYVIGATPGWLLLGEVGMLALAARRLWSVRRYFRQHPPAD